MIALLWAQNIMNGKKAFDDVPNKLKEPVRTKLLEYNRSDLLNNTGAADQNGSGD